MDGTGKKTETETAIEKKKSSEAQMRYLSLAAQLEEVSNPKLALATMVSISIAIVTFVFWAALTNINEVATTPGEVVPDGFQRTIQHLEGGLVKKIQVQEGDFVKKGQELLIFDEVGLKQDLERARLFQLQLELQAERLKAFVENREPDFDKFPDAIASMKLEQATFFKGMRIARIKEARIIRHQIDEKRQAILPLKSDLATAKKNLEIIKEIHERRLTLHKSGYVSDVKRLESEKRVNDLQGQVKRLTERIDVASTELKEFEGRLISLAAKHNDEAYEKLAKISGDIAQNVKAIGKLEERIKRLKLLSPVNGFVKGLALNTIGAVVLPGQKIMEIVPYDKNFVVQIKISPQHIGHIKVNQPVNIKFSTFDFSRYGTVDGRLEKISATTFNGSDGERYYHGRVLLSQKHVGKNPNNLIMPGMTVMAEVITGRKTILDYLLKPIQASLQSAFKER